jgi:type III secretion protein C
MTKTIKQTAALCLSLNLALGAMPASALDLPAPMPAATRAAGDEGFVANKDSLGVVLNALSSKLARPVIPSQKAGKKQLSGNFDLKNPWGMLERLSEQLGLIWYFDGQSVYVYDGSEIKSSMVSLHNISLAQLSAFLKSAGLYDKRYPLKGSPGSATFYISAPPVYVDIVLNSASYMDQQVTGGLGPEQGQQQIAVIGLKNTFVSDRSFKLRDQTVQIPGIASVVQAILRDGDEQKVKGVVAPSASTPAATADADAASAKTSPSMFSSTAPLPGFGAKAKPPGRADSSERISVQAFPETNSLLVKGRPEQIAFIRSLVAQLDIAKRHVELALWIIDISKDSMDQLGVQWGGGVQLGKLSLQLNAATAAAAPLSALDATSFLAQVSALNKKGKANVVTRPVVLTQENVPAIFDHNSTFYSRLQGERTVQLDHVTYGTMISVLPRLSGDAQEIEMMLNIEDGDSEPNSASSVDQMPLVRNTVINTVARVPKGKSLLVGGYTLNQIKNGEQKIPLLGDIPWLGGLFRYKISSEDNNLRLFLIEPRVLDNGAGWDADAFDAVQNPGSKASVTRTLDKLRGYLDTHALN